MDGASESIRSSSEIPHLLHDPFPIVLRLADHCPWVVGRRRGLGLGGGFPLLCQLAFLLLALFLGHAIEHVPAVVLVRQGDRQRPPFLPFHRRPIPHAQCVLDGFSVFALFVVGHPITPAKASTVTIPTIHPTRNEPKSNGLTPASSTTVILALSGIDSISP